MSTSNTHQQSLADVGSKTRPLMLERGPYEFKDFTPSDSQPPRKQTEDDLTGDDLKHYKAEIKAMNLILISILNDIYNSVDACITTQAMCNDGRNTRRSYVQEEIFEGNNAQNDARNTQKTLRTTSSGSAAKFQCHNCSEKGHYARNCPKPKV
ncbi:retrovirus-related pol polyprotein from transposon TNT 1-94 [Tanacetum coccineum]|uniref:Retrovirus-related pol polyprotein from transposon TNT 1-94 n=1 Tax=Tanacetum coccineum TaxID=301880 RepID=A0ABQ5C287_9ASTR